MKKEICILTMVALLFLSLANFSASAQLKKGNVLLNMGLGFGYYYAGGVSLNLNGEYSVTDEIGVGPYFAYTQWDNNYPGGNINLTFIDFGARGSYHFAKLFKVRNEKFDPYAGAFLGLVSSRYDNKFGYDNNAYDGGLRTGVHAGARYFFTNNFAGYGEVSIGLSALVLGISFKL